MPRVKAAVFQHYVWNYVHEKFWTSRNLQSGETFKFIFFYDLAYSRKTTDSFSTLKGKTGLPSA